MKRGRLAFACAIVLLAVLTRARAFLNAQGDANVGTYFYVAQAWLHGSLPYVTAWEYKPPGLFAVFAAALTVFGNPDVAGAVAGTFAVIVTAFSVTIFVRARTGAHERASGILAGFLAVMLATENAGIAGDAELYIDAFVSLAFAAAATQSGRKAAVFSGLAAACALQMKLTALPIVVVVAAFAAERSLGLGLQSLGLFCAVTLAPFLAEAAVYARAGALSFFLDANVLATLRRAIGAPASARGSNLGQWAAELRILAPAVELAPFALLNRPFRRWYIAWAWLLAAVVAVLAASEFYDRHFALLEPPLAVLGEAGLFQVGRLLRAPRVIAIAALCLTFALHDYYEVLQGGRLVAHRFVARDARWHESQYMTVSRALQRAMRGNRSLYVVQFSPALYDDVGAVAPTRYAFSGNLLERGMWPMLGFAGPVELARALAARPDFMVVGNLEPRLDRGSVALVETVLRRRYRLLERSADIGIYRLRCERSDASSRRLQAPAHSRPSLSSVK